jgi:hypothetical protein
MIPKVADPLGSGRKRPWVIRVESLKVSSMNAKSISTTMTFDSVAVSKRAAGVTIGDALRSDRSPNMFEIPTTEFASILMLSDILAPPLIVIVSLNYSLTI